MSKINKRTGFGAIQMPHARKYLKLVKWYRGYRQNVEGLLDRTGTLCLKAMTTGTRCYALARGDFAAGSGRRVGGFAYK